MVSIVHYCIVMWRVYMSVRCSGAFNPADWATLPARERRPRHAGVNGNAKC